VTKKRKPNRTVLEVLLEVDVLFLGSGLLTKAMCSNPLRPATAAALSHLTCTRGPIDVTNAFFQDLGTNGRPCKLSLISTKRGTVSPRGSSRGSK